MEITYEDVTMQVSLDELGNIETVLIGGQKVGHLLSSATLNDIENETIAARKAEAADAEADAAADEHQWRKYSRELAIH